MKNIFELRRLYFIGLFSSIIYPALLIVILGKSPLKDVSNLAISLISASAFVIFYIMFLKVKRKIYENFKIPLILGHLPMVIGFVFSLLEKNYLYILISFPVFLIIYILLIPKEEN